MGFSNLAESRVASVFAFDLGVSVVRDLYVVVKAHAPLLARVLLSSSSVQSSKPASESQRDDFFLELLRAGKTGVNYSMETAKEMELLTLSAAGKF